MSKTDWLAAVFGVTGLVLIVATGVDLVYYRVGLGLLVLGVAILFLALKPGEAAETGGQKILLVMVTLGAGYFAGRALTGGPPGLAVPDAIQVLLFLGVYYFVSSSPEKALSILILGLALLCLGNLALAFYQAPEDNNFFLWKENSGNLRNSTGLFGHYNPFSAFLNGSLFFFLSYLFLGKQPLCRVLCGVLVPGILAGVYLSGSRGGWLSLMVGMTIWILLLIGFLWSRKSRLLGPVVLIGAVLAIGGTVSSIWMVKKISSERMNQGGESVIDVNLDDGGRLAMQQMAFEIFLDSPVTGKGPRAFSHESLEIWDPSKLWVRIGVPEFAHNEYLQVLSDYGVLGLLIILVLLIGHGSLGLYQIMVNQNRSHGINQLVVWQLGAASGLVAILAQCYFSFLIHVPACIVLTAVQLGILARVGVTGKRKAATKIAGKAAMAAIAVSSAFLGWRFSTAFMDRREALKAFERVTTEEEVYSLVKQMERAGDLSWDQSASERAGQELMKFATMADEKGDVNLARRFRERARLSFERALTLNPHSPVALCGIPQIDDALGNHELAERGHLLAMKKLWPLEFHLRPHFFAARGAYARGYQFYREGKKAEAEKYYRISKDRIDVRRKIYGEEKPDSRSMRIALDSWLAFFEAERLYREGDRIWKEARPRDPERAHAFMLAAETRYKASREVIEPVEANWKRQWNQLNKNLELFELGQVKPTKLSPEEIEVIANPEAGLDSSSENR